MYRRFQTGVIAHFQDEIMGFRFNFLVFRFNFHVFWGKNCQISKLMVYQCIESRKSKSRKKYQYIESEKNGCQ